MEIHPRDLRCQKIIAKKPSADAQLWLSDQRIVRSIGSLGGEASIGYVNELLVAGAVRVLAIDIRSHGPPPIPGLGEATETAQGLVIELPADKESRARLFAKEATAAAAQGFDPIADEGQTLLFIKAD